MPQSQVFCAKNGVTGIEKGRVWGGNVMTAMSVGTSDETGGFKPFSATGGSAAVFTETGHVIRGHFAGNDDGMVHASDIKLDTSTGPWLDPDAASSVSKYDKSAAEIAGETFDSFPKVEVDGQTFGLIDDDKSVAKIITTYGNDRSFYGGMYGKGHHIVDGKFLVSEDHYNELHGPLVKAVESTEMPIRFMARAGQRPTAPVYYQMNLVHGQPQQSATTGEHVAAQVNEERTKLVQEALAKMNVVSSTANVTFTDPTEVEDDV